MIPLDLFLCLFVLSGCSVIGITLLVTYLSKKKNPLKILRIILIITLLYFAWPFISCIKDVSISNTARVQVSNSNRVDLSFTPNVSGKYDINLSIPSGKVAEMGKNCFYNGLKNIPACESFYPENILININGQEHIANTLFGKGKAVNIDLESTAHLDSFQTQAGEKYNITITFNASDPMLWQSHPTVIIELTRSASVLRLLQFILLFLPFAVATLFCLFYYIPKKLRERE